MSHKNWLTSFVNGMQQHTPSEWILVVSSTSLFIPLYFATIPIIKLIIRLLLTTSICQHTIVCIHPILRWIDRVIALVTGFGFIYSAIIKEFPIAAMLGMMSSICFVLCKIKENAGNRTLALTFHIATHVLGASGITLYVFAYQSE